MGPRHPGHLPMFVGLHPTMPNPRVGTLVLQQSWQQLLEEMGGELATEWGEGWAPRGLSLLWEGSAPSVWFQREPTVWPLSRIAIPSHGCPGMDGVRWE